MPVTPSVTQAWAKVVALGTVRDRPSCPLPPRLKEARLSLYDGITASTGTSWSCCSFLVETTNFIIPKVLARDEEAYMVPATIMLQHYLMFIYYSLKEGNKWRTCGLMNVFYLMLSPNLSNYCSFTIMGCFEWTCQCFSYVTRFKNLGKSRLHRRAI